MHRLTLPLLALLTSAAPPDPPLCRVTADALPTAVRGIYTVRVSTTTTLAGQPCPPNGYATVRLESGRVYPFKTARPNAPAVFRGIPWYWEGAWRSQSGRTYRFPILGLYAPWETP
jgi:hypothetical protein